MISSAGSWMEGDALLQLDRAGHLPGMRIAVGLPDLHPGKGAPNGAAFASEGQLHPYLVGNDIGCGMALFATALEARRAKVERWSKRLNLEGSLDAGLTRAALDAEALPETGHDGSLGTIGGGNHFAELQAVDAVEDAAVFESLGLRKDQLTLLVHSGSRGLGESILRRHVDALRDEPLAEDSDDARRYLDAHDHAVRWARLNRQLIAKRFLDGIQAQGRRVLDLTHNAVVAREIDGQPMWLHRKGASPADAGPVVIPGSRGALSYLVLPTSPSVHSLFSLAHGAGRKWTRSSARSRMKDRATVAELQRTEIGSRVICEDRALLFEEAPEAYKRIDRVVEDLVEAGLCRVVALLKPLLTYKVRNAATHED